MRYATLFLSSPIHDAVLRKQPVFVSATLLPRKGPSFPCTLNLEPDQAFGTRNTK